MFLVAIHYYDKAKSEKKQKEIIEEESIREKKVLNHKLKELQTQKNESENKDYLNHSSDIESLKLEVIDLKTIHFKNNNSFIEFNNLKGEKYLISRFKAMDFLEDIIEKISIDYEQLSDLSYLEWLVDLGEYSFYDSKQKLEFEKLDELENDQMVKLQIGRLKVLQRLDNIWHLINSIDSELNVDFTNVVKNYIKLKISPIVNKKNTVHNTG